MYEIVCFKYVAQPRDRRCHVRRYVVYTVVLCFWQRLRRICFRPLMVFVDKLCIAQHDEELKAAGTTRTNQVKKGEQMLVQT